MKKLNFNEPEAQLIKDGSLRLTWRLNDEKEININDNVLAIEKNTGKIFGTLLIKEVLTKSFGSINDEDINNSGIYNSHEDAINQMKNFYNDTVNNDSIIKIIKFEYEEISDEKVVNNTSKITEVKLYADGGSRGNPGPSASGFVIEDMKGNVLTNKGIYLGITTNNQAEYQALKFGLEEAIKSHIQTIHIYMDSLLVVNQLKGVYKVRNRDLWPIYESIKLLLAKFKYVTIDHVPREFNKLADEQVNIALDSEV